MSSHRSSTPRRPSRASIVDIKPSYGLFIDGEFVDGTRHSRSRRSTRPPRRCSPRSPRPATPTSTAPSRPPAAPTTRVWGRMPGRERAKYLFRIARIIQERARELAVLESLDNGKPIKESRDVDVPLVAAHFFYYAGWADKLDVRRLRPGPAAARRRRPGHPVELPAADAGVEDRARRWPAATPSCSSRPRPRR